MEVPSAAFEISHPRIGESLGLSPPFEYNGDKDDGSLEAVEDDVDLKQTIATRNSLILLECKQNELSPSFPPTKNNPQNASETRAKAAKIVKGPRRLFIDKVFEDTKKKCTVLMEDHGHEEFDYWIFQEFLKTQYILNESRWLQSEVLKEDRSTLKWRQIFTGKNEALQNNFERIYGPINSSNGTGSGILKCYKDNRNLCAEVSNRKLSLLWDLVKQEFGTDVAVQAVEEMVEDQMDKFKMLCSTPPWLSLPKADIDEQSVYNVNPITNSSHMDWFLFTRFRNPSGPTNYIIRHDNLGQTLEDYKPPSGTIILVGCWPSLVDLTLSHPVLMSEDPMPEDENEDVDHVEKMKEQFSLYRQGKSSPPGALQSICWNTLSKALLENIKEFPMGVQIDKFFEFVKKKQRFKEDADLIPGRTLEEAVKLLPELFVTSQLPKRNSLILFPGFLKDILSEGPMPALDIIRRVWKRMIFLVKVNNGGIIRNMDFQFLYQKVWKMKIKVENWGFRSNEDFIAWSMDLWNEDGRGEGILVEERGGDPDDSWLVYKPAED